MELRNFRRGRHLYSAGRPSRWASAHILVDANYFGSRSRCESFAWTLVINQFINQVPLLVQSEWDESGDDAGRSSDHPLRGENGTGIFNSQAISSEVGAYTLTAREDKRSLHTEGVEASDSRAAGMQSAALNHMQS